MVFINTYEAQRYNYEDWDIYDSVYYIDRYSDLRIETVITADCYLIYNEPQRKFEDFLLCLKLIYNFKIENGKSYRFLVENHFEMIPNQSGNGLDYDINYLIKFRYRLFLKKFMVAYGKKEYMSIPDEIEDDLKNEIFSTIMRLLNENEVLNKNMI
jgi:hypothetical protein